VNLAHPDLPGAATAVSKHLATLTPDPFDSLLRRHDAYTVLLTALDELERAGRRHTTTGPLHAWLHAIPGGRAIGSHDRLMTLLEQAPDHGVIRLDAGQVHIGDVPTGGGTGHIWMRQRTAGGATVELIGATPWPTDTALPEPQSAWWQCTGCRQGRPHLTPMSLHTARQQVTDHATACHYLPPLPTAN
jgi:hypothetical protein